MAEVFSIITAAVGALDVGVRVSAKLAQSIATWKSATPEILALQNEVTDLSVVLEHASNIKQAAFAAATGSDHGFASAIDVQLQVAKRHLSELDNLLNMLQLNHPLKRRWKWFLQKSNTEQIQKHLREARLRIKELVATQNLMVSSQIELELRDVRVNASEASSSLATRLDGLDTMPKDIERVVAAQAALHLQDMTETSRQMLRLMEDMHSVVTDTRIEAGVTMSSIMNRLALLAATNPRWPSNIDSLASGNRKAGVISPDLTNFGAEAGPNLMSASPSVSFVVRPKRQRCSTACNCSCHLQEFPPLQWRLPLNLQRFLGIIFVGYSGYPMTRSACSNRACSKRGNVRAELMYIFPAWFVWCALIISFRRSFVTGPVFSLVFRRRIDFVAGNVLFASEVNQLDVLQSCLTIDSDCVNNTFYNNGRNALWLAVNSGRPEAARLLLQHGANPDAEDDVGESARLHLSILTLGQIHQPEVIRELNQLISISTGVDELEHLSKVILGLRVGDVKSLLQQDDPSARAALNNIDGLGHSALHYAVMRGNPDVVFDLIKAGAYVNIQSLGGLTPLACAACFQLGESCIDVLMDHGADPSILSKDTWSPLMTACFFNRAKVVQRLVARGANVNEASRDGIMSTGAHLAMINDAVEVVEYLTTVDDINWSAREADGGTPFLTTLKVRAPKCLKVLLRNGVDYSDVNDVGDSVLHLAARSGDSELIEILASHGLRGLHVQMRNYAGQTPQEVLRLQHPAALEEVENIFENLIQAVEANINVEADNNKEDVFYDAKDS